MNKPTDTLFDLEQRILNTWNIVDDLRLVYDQWDQCNNKELIKAIADLYQHKFDVLFNQFEKTMQAYFENRKYKENYND